MARRVFVSYSHDDRAWRDAFRQMLGPALERFDVELWADDHIRSGDEWERVIGDAIGDAVVSLLLVTPAHLESRFIWNTEVPALLDAGIPVVWALVEECLWQYNELLVRTQGLQDPERDGALADHASQKKELARLCSKICDEHLARLATVSARAGDHYRSVRAPTPTARLLPSRPGRVFGPVPERLTAFVPRTDDLDRLRAQLVEGLAASVGLTAKPAAFGLHGRGGVGKTVLASELTRDAETLAYFPDGVFWLSLGERPDVVGAQRQLAAWLGGDSESIRSALQGTSVLRELVGARQCLVVLDDVWSLSVAQALAITGPRGRLLITTRDQLLLERIGAVTVSVDVLSPADARQLLGQLTATAPSQLPPEAEEILEATGRVALAVTLAGAAVGRGNQSWARAATRLVEAGELFAGHPYADVFKALEVATRSLGREDLARYRALACFPEDTVIPTETIGRLWGLPEPELSAHLERFGALELARLESGGLLFHDLERDYLLLHAEAAAAAHEQLLAAHQPADMGDWYRLDPADPYLWDHLTYHVAAAGRHHELIETVADPAWLAARIAHDGSLAAEADVAEGLRWEPSEPRLRPLLRRLQQTSNLLDRARRLEAVPATLATHLWPLRAHLDLTRLDGAASGRQPAVAWMADPTSPELVRALSGHTGSVSAVAWSPDGTRLASCGGEDAVQVWDAATGAELAALSGHTGWVNAVAWSPDGTRLASGGADGAVRVWDAATGTERATLSGHTDWRRLWRRWRGSDWVDAVAWSPDGTRLASGGADGAVRVWDAATGTERTTLSGHTHSVNAVAWSPDGTRLASGGDDHTVRVWDAATGTERATLSGHTRSVNAVAWSPDGTRLASGGVDHTARVWDAATGAELASLSGHTYSVNAVAWSPDGTRLALGDADRTVRLWDAATGTERAALSGHAGPVNAVAWSPDGTRLASGGRDDTVRLWDAATGTERTALSGDPRPVNAVAWSPDGTRLASGGGDTLRLWDAATGAELAALSGHTGSVNAVAWSPDGTRLALGDADRTVRLWDAATGTELAALSGHTSWVNAVAWSPDGTRLASGSLDATVRLWDAATGAELAALSGHTSWVKAVAWSPDGTRLASGGGEGALRLWDAATGAERAALSGHTDSVDAVAWSPDGTRLASGGADGAVRVWDAATGAERAALSGHTDSVDAVAWSPDGTRVASGGRDGTVRVWDLATGIIGMVLVVGGRVSAVEYCQHGGLALGVDQSVIVYCRGL